jgi:hypothetical protein
MRTVRVRCTFEINVEVPDDWDDEQILFDIEENHCPGTGRVGAAVDALIAKKDVCWACALDGTNEVLGIVEP